MTNRERVEQAAVENGWLWKGAGRTVIVSKGPRRMSLVFNTAGKLCAAMAGGARVQEGRKIVDVVVRILQS